MADPKIRIGLEAQQTIKQLDQVAQGFDKSKGSIEGTTSAIAKFNKEGEAVEKTLKGMLADGTKFTAQLDKEANAFKLTSIQVDKNTAAIERLQKAEEKRFANFRAQQQREYQQLLAQEDRKKREQERNVRESLNALDRESRARERARSREEQAVQRAAREAQRIAREQEKIQAASERANRDSIGQAASSMFIGGIRPKGEAPFTQNTKLGFVPIQNLKQMEAAYKSLSDVAKKHGFDLQTIDTIWKRIGSGDIRNYGGSLDKLQAALLRVKSTHENTANAASRQWATLRKEMEQLTKGAKGFSDQMREVTISWSGLVRLALIQGVHQIISNMTAQLSQSLQESIKLEKSLSEILTISQDTSGATETTAKWLQVAVNLSNDFGVSLADQTAAAYQALSDQVIKTADDYAFFGRQVNAFAVTTQSSIPQSTALLTAALNSFNLPLSETDRVAANFFKTIEIGRVRADEIGETFGQIGILASELGVSLEELNSLVAVGTIRGIKYAEIQTQIRGVLSQLIKPSEAMKGFLEGLGVESGEAAIKTFGLTGVLGLLQSHVAGANDELAALFPNIRGLNLATLVAGKGLTEYRKALDQITNSADSFERAQEIIAESPAKQLEKEAQKIRNFFTQDFSIPLIETAAKLNTTFGSISGGVITLADLLKNVLAPAALVAGNAILLFLSKFALTNPIGLFITASAAALTAIDAFTESDNERLEALRKRTSEEIEQIQNLERERLRASDENIRRNQLETDEILKNKNLQSATIITGLQEQIDVYDRAYAKIKETIEDAMEISSNNIKESMDYGKERIKDFAKEAQNAIDSIRDRRKDTNKTLFNWELEGKTAAEKLSLIQRRLTELRQAAANAATTGDNKLFQDLNSEIQQLFEEAQSITSQATNSLRTDVNRRGRKGGRPRSARERSEDSAAAGMREQFQQQFIDFQNDTDALDQQIAQRAKQMEARERIAQEQRQAAADKLKKTEEEIAKFKDDQKKGFENEETIQLENELRRLQTKQLQPTGSTEERNQLNSEVDAKLGELQKAREQATAAAYAQNSKNLTELANQTQSAAQQIYEQSVKEIQENFIGDEAQQLITIAYQKRLQAEEEIKKLRQAASDQAKQAELELIKLREQAEQRAIKNRIEANQNDISSLKAERDRLSALRGSFQTNLRGLSPSLDPSVTDFTKPLRETSLADTFGFLTLGVKTPDFLKIFNQFAGQDDFGLTSKNISLTPEQQAITDQLKQLQGLQENLQSGNASPEQLQDAKTLIDSLLTNVSDQLDTTGLAFRKQLEDLSKNLEDLISAGGEQGLEESFNNTVKALEDATNQQKEYATQLKEPIDRLDQTVGSLDETLKSFAEEMRKRIAEMNGGTPIQKAFGGHITGVSPAYDNIAASLSPGEFVMNARSASRYRAQLLTMNAGLAPVTQKSNTGSNYQFGDINIDARGQTDGTKIGRQAYNEIRRMISSGQVPPLPGG